MNFLPIAIRELQVAARRPMTYYWRSLCALQAACIALYCLLVAFSGMFSAGAAGEATFQILSGAVYMLAGIAAVLETSDCISEERRNGTLGFLFLTDLKGYDVVVGKLARLSAPVYSLVAVVPALGFTMLLGGVSLSEFARVAVALLNVIFFFSALGLLVSACSRNGHAATSVAMAGLLMLSAPMLGALLGLHFSNLGLALFLPTPAGAFLAALLEPASAISRPNFYLSLAVSHALGWLFLLAASRLVGRNFSREEPQPVARPRRVDGPNPALALYAGRLEQRPWRPLLLLAALVGLIAAVAKWSDPKGWYDPSTFFCVTLGLHLILKFWAAHDACRSLPSRRQSGELELLLTTPMDIDAILLGSTTAIKRQLLWPFLFVAAMDGLLLILGWRKLGFWDGFGFAAAMLLEFLWFIGNLYSLTWVGLWMGLTAGSHAKALGRTLFYILFLPWSGVAVAAPFFWLSTAGSNFAPWLAPVTVGEFVVALAVCNLGFAGWAVSELRDRFRLLAASQPLPPKRFVPPWKEVRAKLRFGRGKRTPQTA